MLDVISADLLKGSRELESFLPGAFSSLLLRRWGKPLVNIIYIHGTFLTILWNKNYMYCRLKKITFFSNITCYTDVR